MKLDKESLVLIFMLYLIGFVISSSDNKNNVEKLMTIDIESALNALLIDQLNQNISNIEKGDFKGSCELECPPGFYLIQKPDNIPDINGCGSYNININFSLFNMHEFDNCCNIHDECYEICSETKTTCDNSFKRCLINTCDTWNNENNWNFFQSFACKSITNIMVAAVTNLGCKAYYDSRVKACDCLTGK